MPIIICAYYRILSKKERTKMQKTEFFYKRSSTLIYWNLSYNNERKHKLMKLKYVLKLILNNLQKKTNDRRSHLLHRRVTLLRKAAASF